ncbi:PAS domain-containing protein [Limnobacter humi]|uniref:PAS domain-containing protein n=1 Tax=Limnobacter humi TaxID=1778671 RepID=A0ABT1WIJ6_9BURK|nr:PAS domain-containing protein [Limnobacter humi]MCQ8897334.1 PAS domain-containing protein [Limnobacter humi]
MPDAKRPQLATIFLRHSAGIVLALVVPMLLAGFWYLSARLTQQTLKGLSERAFFVQALLNNQLNALADQAHTASNRLQTKPVSEWSARELTVIHQMLPNAAWLGAADETGRIQTATGDVLAGAQVSSLPWYRDALQEPRWIDRRPAWIALDTHQPPANASPYTMELGVPIHREDGSLAGVLGMVVDWTLAQQQLEKVFGEQHQDPDVSYLVLGADGEVRLSHLSARLESDTPAQLLHEIRKHEYATGDYLIAEPAERSTGPMHNLNWTVYAIRPARGVTNAVLEVVWIGLLGMVLSLALFSVLTHRYLRALSRKIQAHLETLVNRPESDSNTIDIGIPREFCDILLNIAKTLKHTHCQRIQTDQQLAQANLNFAEIRGVIEQLPMAVAMFDRNMRYLGCSNQWQTTYLAQVENPIGQSHYDLIPTISDGWKAAHQAGLSGQHLHENHDHWVTPEGKDMWLDWVIEPWRNAQGEVGGIIIAAKDITEEEQIKRALQLSEQRFQLAMEAVNDGIVDWNPVTDELYVSTVWLRVLGLPEHTRLVRMAQLEALILNEDRARVAELLQQAPLHVQDNHLVAGGGGRHRFGHFARQTTTAV